MKNVIASLKLPITFLAASSLMIMLSCNDDDNQVREPVIESFSPASAFPGASVTISGSNFSTTPAINQVSFNGVGAAVTSGTATKLIVTVPELATTGKIAVTVNGKTAASSADFIVLQTAVTGFSPVSGTSGTVVTITGTSFSTTLSENIVKFNGVSATVTSASSTQLIVSVPETATTGEITVTVNGRTTTSSTDFTVLQTTITGFSPQSGINGTTVIIAGTNFSTAVSENIVKFNGVAATVSAATSTQLTVIVPADATTGIITVTIQGKTTSSANDFIVPPPTITGYSTAIAAPGISVAITGTNFSSVTTNNTVKFNGVDAAVTSATSTQLTVTVPGGATTGPLTVKVGVATATGSADFQICTGSAELVISDIVLTNSSGASSYQVSFKITNVGEANADLTKMIVQNYASSDNALGADVGAGGYQLSFGPTLSPGQSYAMPTALSGIASGGNTTSHPYFIITLSDFPDGSVPECNVDNNIVIKPFN